MPNTKSKWKLEDIERMKMLFGQGKPIKEIASILNRGYDSIATKAKRLEIKHPYLQPSFKPEISNELAYILGAWFGDRTSPKKLGIFVKDEDFAMKFHSHLEKILNRKINVKRYGDRFFVQRIDKNFAEWISSKSMKDVKKFVESGGEFAMANFLSGFFDAEGTVIKRYAQVTQKKKEILEICKELLAKLNISSSLFRENRENENESYYVLRIQKLSSLINFYNEIGFNISRKQKNLRKVVKAHLKNHVSSLERYNEFVRLIKEDITRKDIAEKLKVSIATIYNWQSRKCLPILVKNNIDVLDLQKLEGETEYA